MNDAELMRCVTLAIIAGGRGTRMGGPKHRLRVDGRPMVRDVVERCGWEGPTMLVTGTPGERVEGSECVGRVVPDGVEGEGPLRGVLTAIQHAETEGVVVVPVDMPRIGGEQVRWVARRGMETGAAGMMMRRMQDGAVRIEPFPGFFRRDCAPAMLARLATGRRSLHGMAEEPEVRVVDAPGDWDAGVWVNLNTPRDVEGFGGGVARL
jgi:molybdenum cofactor guanylyltransferase